MVDLGDSDVQVVERLSREMEVRCVQAQLDHMKVSTTTLWAQFLQVDVFDPLFEHGIGVLHLPESADRRPQADLHQD